MRPRLLAIMLVLLATLSATPKQAEARVKLITLPVRQRVEIQLDHSQATLVEEERIVPLVAGVNQVDFSWANTQIDPDTILFRVLPRPDGDAKPLDVKVLSVSYLPNIQIQVRSQVVGWNDHTIYTQRVRNLSGKPIDLEVRRSLDGHVIVRSQLTATNHDFRTVEYTATVPAGEQADLLYEVVVQQGRNAKQNNVTLEAAEVTP